MTRTAAIVSCLLALCLPGCGKRVYERAELEKKVKGLSEDQLRRAMGSPDEYQQGAGRTLYTYKDRCRKKAGSDVEDVIVVVEGGRVAWLSYPADPPVQTGDTKVPLKFK